jgi:hypothetical protein
MALTDKSAIPLSKKDLRRIDGEPRFMGRRISLRCGFQRPTWFRQLAQRWDSTMEQAGLGKVLYRTTPGFGGDAIECYATVPQALFLIAKSGARNSNNVLAEICLVAAAVHVGEPIPDTPFTDALFAPDTPEVTHEGNIAHVAFKQDDLFGEPAPSVPATENWGLAQRFKGRHTAADMECLPHGPEETELSDRAWAGTKFSAKYRDGFDGRADQTWTDDGIVVRRVDHEQGHALFLFMGMGPYKQQQVVGPTGPQVYVEVSPGIPVDVVIRNYERLGLGKYQAVGIATLRHLLTI